MGTAIERIYEYRHLLGRCHRGAGLDFEQIDTLTEIEAEYSALRNSRARAGLKVELRFADLSDRVSLVELGPTTAVCRQAPYVEDGQVVEILIEDTDDRLVYRFKARVEWLRDDVNDDFALGLAFVGVPLQMRLGPESDKTHNLVHRIAA